MIRTLIVDDEALIRQMIKGILVSKCPEIIVIAEASDIDEAYNIIKDQKPDLVLLDIKMPGGSGFDLLSKLGKIDFKIIFITAYEEFAIKAFEFAAIDYILKPLDPDALFKAIEKAKFAIHAELSLQLNTLLNNISSPSNGEKKLVLKTSNNIHIVNIDSIIHLESDHNYSVFYINDGRKIVVSKTLREYDDLLEKHDFFRVHKSHLINLKQISRFERANGGTLIMSNESRIPVASRKKESLLELFDKM